VTVARRAAEAVAHVIARNAELARLVGRWISELRAPGVEETLRNHDPLEEDARLGWHHEGFGGTPQAVRLGRQLVAAGRDDVAVQRILAAAAAKVRAASAPGRPL
jgi:hypothetical protein